MAFQASNSTVVVPVEPEETDGANAGLFVARNNTRATLRIRFWDNLSLKLIGEFSPHKKAMQIAEESLGTPKGAAASFGFGVEYSVPVKGPWRLGVAGDLSMSTNPFREEGRCIQNCDGASDYSEEGNHSIPIYSMSVVPSFNLGEVVVFGGLTLRNHPTNTRKNRQIVGTNDEMDELRKGPNYFLVGVGLEVPATRYFSFVAHVFQPLSTDIARYGPAIGLAIRGDLYDPKPTRYSRSQAAKALAH